MAYRCTGCGKTVCRRCRTAEEQYTGTCEDCQADIRYVDLPQASILRPLAGP